MSRRFPSLFPDDRTITAHLMPLIVALMALMASLSTSLALTALDQLNQWKRQLDATLTIETQASLQDTLQALSPLAKAQGGCCRFDPVTREEAARLLFPWLGEIDPETLPLPALIDVTADGLSDTQLQQIKQRLTAAHIDAVIHNHANWIKELRRSIHTIAAFCGLLAAALLGCAVLTVAAMTISRLSALSDETILLRQLGASDQFIAMDIQWNALRQAFFGAALGVALAGLALMLFKTLIGDISVLNIRFHAGIWLGLLSPVLILPLATFAVARLTVLHVLARIGP